MQAGYLLSQLPLEVAARGGQVFAADGKTSLIDSGELGGAVSYYMSGHPFKLQLDYFRTYAGQQTLSDDADQVRLQMQM